MPIPIRNIYYLFCYAWGHFREGQQIDVAGIESPELQDLLAHTLISGTNHLLRRGLDRGYIEVGEDTGHPRGRIDFGETVKRVLLQHARVHCLVDELSHDVLQNQILKATIGRLRRVEGLDPELQQQLSVLFQKLGEVSDIRLTRQTFRRIQCNSNNAFYRFLLKLCELSYQMLLPEEGGTGFRFYNVLEDEVRMANVFEAFVRNFYHVEQSVYRRGPRTIHWDLDLPSDEIRAVLPGMENDIRLDGPGRTIVIDTKYYKDALRSHYGRRILHSGNLYQIFSYLKNLRPALPPGTQLEGILLYPAAAQELDLTLSVQGNSIRVYTLNLNQDWRQIHADLLGLLMPAAALAA